MAGELPLGGCPKCGAVGLHACTGSPVVWTKEEEKRLDEAFAQIFGFPLVEKKSVAKPGEGE